MANEIPMYVQSETPRQSTTSSVKKTKLLFGILAICGIAGAIVATVFATQNNDKVNDPSSTSSASASIDLEGFRKCHKRSPFLNVHLHTKSAKKLALTVPHATLGKSFIVHAVYNKGTYHERTTARKALYMTTHFPAETESRTVFHFELSENKQTMKYVREQYKIRTSDNEMEYALKDGAWVAHEAELPILKISKYGYMIDASKLALNGFYVADYKQTKFEMVYEGTQSFEKNSNFIINYYLPRGRLANPKKKGDNHPEWHSLFFSITPLPEKLMTSRAADDRVGYFSTKYTDLGLHNGLYGSKSNSFKGYERQSMNIDTPHHIIHRRRLDYKNGKVHNPIIFYIDPTIPKTWRKYFKQGVDQWQRAFEAIGLKDAIRGVLPEDKDWPQDYQVGDFRFNTISMGVAINTVSALAIGPSVADPRTGEILVSNIQFSSNRFASWMRSVESYSPVLPESHEKEPLKYFHQRGMCDSQRLDMDIENMELTRMLAGDVSGEVSEEIVGSAIANVAAHEVGHTLGLRHNFIASTARTVEQLKDTEYIRKHGLASSVMDYLPLNSWANMTQEQVNQNTWYTGVVGEYDIAAVEYGYKPLENEISGIKHEMLNKIAANAPAFASDYEQDESPYITKRDMSSTPLVFYIDRIELFKKLRKTLDAREVMKDETWARKWAKESRLISGIGRTIAPISKYIGGVLASHAHKNALHPNGPNIKYVSKEDQISALKVLLDIALGENNIFPQPEEYKNYIERVGTYGVKSADVDGAIQKVKNVAILSILDEKTLNRIVMKGSSATLTIEYLLSFVYKIVMTNSDPSNLTTKYTTIAALSNLAKKSKDPRISLAAAAVLKTKKI